MPGNAVHVYHNYQVSIKLVQEKSCHAYTNNLWYSDRCFNIVLIGHLRCLNEAFRQWTYGHIILGKCKLQNSFLYFQKHMM